jgi:hypothetical protein
MSPIGTFCTWDAFGLMCTTINRTGLRRSGNVIGTGEATVAAVPGRTPNVPDPYRSYLRREKVATFYPDRVTYIPIELPSNRFLKFRMDDKFPLRVAVDQAWTVREAGESESIGSICPPALTNSPI